MPRLMFGVFLGALVLVLEASAEAPSGFSQFPWGTTPGVLREQLLTKRCGRVSESLTSGWQQIVCHRYALEGVSAQTVTFDFEPTDALAGYSMFIARGSYQQFRDLAVERFGRPTSRRGILWQGEVIAWTTDNVTATLTERCAPELSCMEVTTRALDRKRQQLADRKRQDSLQGF
jgi:hypothetical protein